jgi:O-antigen ligase
MLFSSRGSFVGVLIYMIFELFYSRRFILSNRIRVLIYLLISLLFFSVSVLRIDNSELSRASVDQLINNASVVSSSLENIASNKDNVNVWFSFYWHYGRLESTDPTTNWRLDIWQDVVHDLIDENRIFQGYGYNEVFPQMLDPTAPGRLGSDGMNENIHNYFVNILARGGLIQFALFITFHLGLIAYWKDKSNNYQILMYIIPSFFVSSLDITMEGVQYPLIYYFFLYYFLQNSTKVKVVELYG